MKTLFYLSVIILVVTSACTTNLHFGTQGYDDVYYNPDSKTTSSIIVEKNDVNKDKSSYEETYNSEFNNQLSKDIEGYTEETDYYYDNNQTSEEYYDEDGSYIVNNYYGDYYEDDGYYGSYSHQFTRFGHYYYPSHYYDPYWSPYWGWNSGWYIGYSYNPWYYPYWGYSPWYHNSWHNGYWHGYNDGLWAGGGYNDGLANNVFSDTYYGPRIPASGNGSSSTSTGRVPETNENGARIGTHNTKPVTNTNTTSRIDEGKTPTVAIDNNNAIIRTPAAHSSSSSSRIDNTKPLEAKPTTSVGKEINRENRPSLQIDPSTSARVVDNTNSSKSRTNNEVRPYNKPEYNSRTNYNVKPTRNNANVNSSSRTNNNNSTTR
ncbi:MAG: hypothetical protein PHW82_12165, partial [Bacteroidales bacterium]|nr:hypothetical protein [Bacteroidales bacterium]